MAMHQVAQGIHIANLTVDEIGRWVRYVPGYGPRESGRIKSWNEKFIFVVYHCDDMWPHYQHYTAAATKPMDLEFIKREE